MRKLLFLMLSAVILTACGNDERKIEEPIVGEESPDQVELVEEEPIEEEIEELSVKDEMVLKVIDLIDEDVAFDTGSYIKGDIPKGEYAFVSFDGSGEYYVEKNDAGEIIDNENFSSFGYVLVHEAGNLETKGLLVKIEALEKLEVSGAKELYEILNEKENYHDSGYYKVGSDIEPGEYVIESQGSGYIGVLDGPVGNNNIIENDNFDGRYAVNLQDGQYVKISRAIISQ